MKTIALLVAAVAFLSGIPAQRAEHAKGPGGVQIPYSVHEPGGYDKNKLYPVVLEPGIADTKESTAELVAAGFVVVRYRRGKDGTLPDVLRHLRLTYRIESQRFYLYSPGADPEGMEARAWAAARPFDFTFLEGVGRASRARTIQAARAGLLPKDPAVRAASLVLDDFHDCAAKADGPRYFDHFAPKGVFLGTDATERWPQAEFRKWGMKYFERDSAWIYVPQSRNIDVVGGFAWFDELLRNDSYGECRGTGVLQRIGGVWRVAQEYHLTVPVPNPLMADVVARIRAAANASTVAGETTVFVVRHAEKQKGGRDPLLDEKGAARARRLQQLLASAKITRAFSTQFQRTQATARPTAAAAGIEVTSLDARKDVAKLILEEHRGQTVLVVGHSNTVPAILRRLGVQKRIRMAESDYGDLFVVTIAQDGRARLLHLHY